MTFDAQIAYEMVTKAMKSGHPLEFYVPVNAPRLTEAECQKLADDAGYDIESINRAFLINPTV